MNSKGQKLINFINQHGGVIRFSVLLKARFHPDSLVALKRGGIVEKIGRGLYRLTEHAPGAHPDLVTACLQAPKGVICLLSALAYHGATDEIPKAVDIAIERGAHANRIDYPPVRFYRYASQTWKVGIEEYDIQGNHIRVYNLAKTLADCFKFRNRIGMDVARDALKFAINQKRISPKEIMHYAKVCRVSNIIKPIIESII